MEKPLYRVGETANLKAFPRGTKVGDEIELTDAQALYERDMGRITPVEALAAEPVPGETQGHPVDAVSGEPLQLTDEERARLPVLEQPTGEEPVELSVDEAQTDPGDGIIKTPVEGDTLVVTDPSPVEAMPLTTGNADRLADEVGTKPRALRKL
jgi:hypothetical protein